VGDSHIFYAPKRELTGFADLTGFDVLPPLVLQPIDVDKMPCTACGEKAPLHYAQLVGHIAFHKRYKLGIPYDYYFCSACRQNFEGDWPSFEDAIVHRKRTNGEYKDSSTERNSRDNLFREYSLAKTLLAERGFKSILHPDYRFNYEQGFSPGSLPTADDSTDAHCWLAHQEWKPTELGEVQEKFWHAYSYAIPTLAALEMIAAHSPDGLVEFGCGRAYWSYLLKRMGVSVKAIDVEPQGKSGVVFFRYNSAIDPWTPVDYGGIERLTRGTAKRTLLLVWPPEINDMADAAIQTWRGNTLAYVGEWYGCTGTCKFHERLLAEFDLVDEVHIPTFYGYFDSLRIFKRAILIN
jgi:hypothetical protein